MSVKTIDSVICPHCKKEISSEELEKEISSWGEFDITSYSLNGVALTCPHCDEDIFLDINLIWVTYDIEIKLDPKIYGEPKKTGELNEKKE